MAKAGIEEVGIIIAPETGDEIRAAAGDGSRFGVKITYILQDAPLGLAHAVLTAEPFLRRLAVRHVPRRQPAPGRDRGPGRGVSRHQPDALILLTPVPDPEHYGVAELRDGAVVRLVEKPPEPRTDLALVGVYMFTSCVHDAARAIEPSGRGELEITDAIQHLVDQGRRVEPHIVKGWWKDTGRLEDMLAANRLVLDTIAAPRRGRADRLAGRRPRRDRGRRPARALSRPRTGDHRRRRAADRLLRRPVHGDRRGLRDLRTPRSSTRSCSPDRSVRDLDGRMESSLLGPQRQDRPRPPPAPGLPVPGRRQLRDRDPLGVPQAVSAQPAVSSSSIG